MLELLIALLVVWLTRKNGLLLGRERSRRSS